MVQQKKRHIQQTHHGHLRLKAILQCQLPSKEIAGLLTGWFSPPSSPHKTWLRSCFPGGWLALGGTPKFPWKYYSMGRWIAIWDIWVNDVFVCIPSDWFWYIYYGCFDWKMTYLIKIQYRFVKNTQADKRHNFITCDQVSLRSLHPKVSSFFEALCCWSPTVTNLSRIDFHKIDQLAGAKLFWGSHRL